MTIEIRVHRPDDDVAVGADKESPAEFVNAHTICDRYLEDSGLAFVVVRPNLFLQNIPESTIPSIDQTGTFYVAGQARISMVDTRDVAAVARRRSDRARARRRAL